MSENQIKAFIEKVNGDTDLQEKVKAGEDILEIAKEAGFDFTKEEFETYLLIGKEAKLSEAELEGVAGGVTL